MYCRSVRGASDAAGNFGAHRTRLPTTACNARDSNAHARRRGLGAARSLFCLLFNATTWLPSSSNARARHQPLSTPFRTHSQRQRRACASARASVYLEAFYVDVKTRRRARGCVCAAPCWGAATAASAAAMPSLMGSAARARAACTSSFFSSLCQHMRSA